MAHHKALTWVTAAAVAVTLALSGTVSTGTAAAAPSDSQPTSSDEAKAAWLEAARGAEELNQAVLTAQQTVATQQAAAAAAQVAADATIGQVQAADVQVAAADAQVAAYQPKLDAVATASLKGVRMSSFSSLLTAGSADDYLDQVSALDQVAGETLNTMSAAKSAKAAADAAKVAADGVRATAQQAADAAAGAVAAAQQAAADLATQQAAMQDTIVSYEQLYSSLSVSERGEAIADFENSNLSPEAAATVAAEAAQRAALGITDANLSEMSVREAPDTAAAIAVAAALTRRGMPYVWGAVGPDSFDCSGLMLWAWAQAGITIPRTSAEQATLPEVPMDQLEPGDLITMYSPVSHVGMYIGHGLMIHASTAGTPLKVIAVEKAAPFRTGHRVPR